MTRRLIAVVLTCAVLAMSGCGGHDEPPLFRTQILSDAAVDGDIARDLTSGALTITQGMSTSVQSVFAGVDPATAVEYRAFLHFPLTGAGGVPGNATINSATLDIFIDSVAPANIIPITIELVDFQPPTLVGSDFDRTQLPPLASATILPRIVPADAGNNVVIDVTPLMREAQRLGLLDFQVRLLQDFSAGPTGLMEIDDSTGANRADLAPLLDVTYF